MSIGATRKISSTTSATKADKSSRIVNKQSQFVENIDTTNNVLVRDESGNNQEYNQNNNPQKKPVTDVNSATVDISSSIESIALSELFDNADTSPHDNSRKVNVYSNNQVIVKDEDVERTGRNYLKHFYEKNEHLSDVDELV